MSEEFRAALGRTEDRLSDRQDKLIDRVEEGVAKIVAKIDLRMDASDHATSTEIGEVKIALGELRDGQSAQRRRLDALEAKSEGNMRASAEGAAKGAGEAAGAVATAAAAVVHSHQPLPFLKTAAGRIVAVCAVFSAIVAALSQLPNVVKYAGVFFTFLAGLAK
jgi:hypothetical protein